MPRKCLDVSLRLLAWLRTRPLVGYAKRHIVTKTTPSDAARGRPKTYREERRFPVALGRGMLRTGDAALLKGATAGSHFSSPRLGRTATISLALVAGAGAHICGGTLERIRLRAWSHCQLS